ncbi:MAG: hypothetical protein QOE45_2705 [Frankiaceae bacterium]|jgi:hypothetical protein|nr:hypothetical protein [Frankiaceae bacterium]
MRTMTRAAFAALTLGLLAAPFAGTSNAGCVRDFAGKPYYTSPVVTQNPDGSITIDPNPVVGLGNQVAANVVGLEHCVV